MKGGTARGLTVEPRGDVEAASLMSGQSLGDGEETCGKRANALLLDLLAGEERLRGGGDLDADTGSAMGQANGYQKT